MLDDEGKPGRRRYTAAAANCLTSAVLGYTMQSLEVQSDDATHRHGISLSYTEGHAMGFLDDYFEDKEHGGLFHAMSENFQEIRDSDKHADDQFTAARASVIAAMITHDPVTIRDAEAAVGQVIKRFEDPRHGGYFSAADRTWRIIDRTKNLVVGGELFGVLMHLYEVSQNDAYLLRALDFLDVLLERAWDGEHGGFFPLYQEDWTPSADSKDLKTQASMLQHINGSWKDGMDSPYGARSARHKKHAEAFADLLIERCTDSVNGGFYTDFSADWRPVQRDKDVAGLAAFALALYFHYHNMGPSIWGPRKGSHAYTGKPYPAAYAYRGPAPQCEQVSGKAYRYGRAVVEIADLLLQHAWDGDRGGFYTSLTERLEPRDRAKRFATQMDCLLALNVAYRLSGFERFQKRLAEAVAVLEDRCFDAEHGGVYAAFDRDWNPVCRDKLCGLNLMSMGILSMMAPVVNNLPVTRQTIVLWVEPSLRVVPPDSPAQFTVTVQNQGFAPQRVRVGGLTSPSRWMEPADLAFDLAPHEVRSYKLTVRPPEGMPAGRYPFEITGVPAGDVGEYASASGMIEVRER